MQVDPCTHDGPWPFDRIVLHRLQGEDGEPNGWVEIVGEREGGERSVRIPYERLWQQMEVHMRSNHGSSMDDVHSFEELEHATLRAAVVFLMD
jgi:hypothetical protein